MNTIYRYPQQQNFGGHTPYPQNQTPQAGGCYPSSPPSLYQAHQQQTPLHQISQYFYDRLLATQQSNASNQHKTSEKIIVNQLLGSVSSMMQAPQPNLSTMEGKNLDVITKIYNANISSLHEKKNINFNNGLEGQTIIPLTIKDPKNPQTITYPTIDACVAYSTTPYRLSESSNYIIQPIPIKGLNTSGHLINYITPIHFLTDEQYATNRSRAMNIYKQLNDTSHYSGQESKHLDIAHGQQLVWNPQCHLIKNPDNINKFQYRQGTERSIFSWTPTIEEQADTKQCGVSLDPPLLYDRNVIIDIINRAQNVRKRVQELISKIHLNVRTSEWLNQELIEDCINLDCNNIEWANLSTKLSSLDPIKTFDTALQLSGICQAYIENMNSVDVALKELRTHASRKQNTTPRDVINKLNQEIDAYSRLSIELKDGFTQLRLQLPDPYLLEYKKLKSLDKQIAADTKHRNEDPEIQNAWRTENEATISQLLMEYNSKSQNSLKTTSLNHPTSPFIPNNYHPIDQLLKNIDSKIENLGRCLAPHNKQLLIQIQETKQTILADWKTHQNNQKLADTLGAQLTTSFVYHSNTSSPIKQPPPGDPSQFISNQQSCITTTSQKISTNPSSQMTKPTYQVHTAATPFFPNHSGSLQYKNPAAYQNTSCALAQNQQVHPQPIRQNHWQPQPQKQPTQPSKTNQPVRQYYPQLTTTTYTNYPLPTISPNYFGFGLMGRYVSLLRR